MIPEEQRAERSNSPVLLALDTSGAQCGVALFSGDHLAYEECLAQPRIHGSSLAPMIERVLKNGEMSRDDVDAVVISEGPGSFTGLRIGASTAKGFAYARHTKLIGIPTLDALVRAHVTQLPPGSVVFAILPSRRGEVFARSYRVARPPEFWPVSEVESLPIEQFILHLEAPVRKPFVLGEGLDPHVLEPVAKRIPDHKVVPTVRGVGWLGLAAWHRGGFADVSSFEPRYLKEFVAKKGKPIFERLRSSMQ
jgi:tRNA threonylcarbamoyladenosine biosynthesis protein TsaB